MANQKLKVGILFGGKSAEHEISLRSAKNVIDALDTSKYEAVLIGIDKSGRWLYNTKELLVIDDQNEYQLNEASTQVALIPECQGLLININSGHIVAKIDAVFPILHGPCGEDGTMQGLLKLANVPYVGPNTLGSAVGMDKDIMKRLLRDAGLNIGDYIALRSHESRPTFQEVTDKLGLPCFVKPANLGSSVGISRVDKEDQFEAALDEAFAFDHKIVIEKYIEGQEIECAVLGNEYPEVSVLGEISFSHDFYSYEAKYQDDKGYKIQIPAELPAELTKEVQQVSVKTFQALSCEGFSRVDSFVTKDGEIIVNEINTIPGFTQISMYPKLWEASGLSYTDLISKLIELAMDRFKKDQSIRSSI